MIYNWILKNKAAIFELIPETFRSCMVSAFGSAFCSAEHAVDCDEFVKSHLHKLPWVERSLEAAMETICLSAALREEAEEELINATSYYG